jgi:hypothetical protein
VNGLASGGALVPLGALRTDEVAHTEREIEEKVKEYRRRLREIAGLPPRRAVSCWRRRRTSDGAGKPIPTAASVLFGERVSEARDRSGLMNQDFAKLGGVSPCYVSQCVRGQVRSISSRLREAIKIWEVDITGLPEPFNI